MTISIRSVEKSFGRYPALNGVSLEIQDGELLALLGPSGSGKTTLLRVIAGLEFPEAGQVLFEAEDVTFAGAAERRVGFVFQQYALFKHMTVARNIAFGLDVRKGREKPPRGQIAARVDELLNLVELGGLGKRFPAQLSGGQRQRVALARALAVNPRVLLLDEPFGALDATVRKSLRKELRRIHDATGVTTIFVTHDQEEALELADRVAILNSGRIEQVGTPDQVHDAPASPFVCGFVGEANRFEGEVRAGVFQSGDVSLKANGAADGPASAFVRPHEFVLWQEGVPVTVHRPVVQGPLGRFEGFMSDGRKIDVSLSRKEILELTEGAQVRIRAQTAHVYPIATSTG
ncbi:MAG TPA: sulfate/molybdate ABC transporter ATP-binding protein [Caulobacteraceae bacterium]|jgi:sulfate transport system ATP-binding protein|nr:sulfate/molybdate ABC transporter ATP-binding protein [Caulobacteraceae bacterium]